MPTYTAWGTPITFSWELEGNTTPILQWFAPPGVQPGAWKQLPQNARVDYFTKQVLPQWRRRKADPGICYDDFVNVSPVNWVKLTQEVWFETWEMQCTTPFPDTPEGLFAQLDFVRQTFPSDRNDFQVHIVFALPAGGAEKKLCSALLMGLFTQLNDYAMAKLYRKHPEIIQDRFYGASTVNHIALFTSLVRGDKLEVNKASGYKFNFVGMRKSYDTPDKIGLEIREGWSTDYDKFKSLITRVVGMLGTLSEEASYTIKASKPDNAVPFTLLEHLAFMRDTSPESINLPEEKGGGESLQQYEDCDGLLYKEACRLVEAASNESRIKKIPFPQTKVTPDDKLQWLNDPPDVLYARWRKALLPWELHPVFEGNTFSQQGIVVARTKLKNALAQYLVGLEEKRVTPTDSFVHEQVKTFFETTQLFKYL
ncbi:hypothetical protein D7W79_04490 [Corallococcus exercitus]|uniref:hypothetical protein n=1 Tax=Corallococcus exercitus TaxID=2316736 RepID=UPI000EA2564C|nr:hypothetical protein [Corallococcus exercitus]RKG81747.1 hypothetical protein D7W79_04490 [Corallococcus exercitus]